MSADQYLRNILLRERVDTGPFSPVRSVVANVAPAIQRWGGSYLLSIEPSGSFAKGTCNKSGTDIDLFLSLTSTTPDSLGQIYSSLKNQLTQSGYNVREQNVSLRVQVGLFKVDLVPAKRQSSLGNDHSLYRRKVDSWTKTNVQVHIATVSSSNRTEEIRILKLWRDQKALSFPSIYLELLAIEALRGKRIGDLASNVFAVFSYLRDHMQTTRIVDPANTANIISDDLTHVEKQRIAGAASQAMKASNWNQILI